MRHLGSTTAGLRIHRRGFLDMGVAGLGGLSLSLALRHSAIAAPESKTPAEKNVIVIFLTGGPATIDMWDMKPQASQNIRGPFRPIDTAVHGVQICEFMPQLATTLQRATLVRSVTHTIAEHAEGQTYVMTGNRPTPTAAAPSLGSLAARLLSTQSGMPTYMTMGSVPAAGAGDLGAADDPFELVSVSGPRGQTEGDVIGLPAGFTAADLERRRTLLQRIDRKFDGLTDADLPKQLDRFEQQAFEILRSDKINQALNLAAETPSVRERYGSSPLGGQALAARRLIEAGARFVTIGFGDWDTHLNNFTRLQTTLLPQLDRALAALLHDLDERGLLDETIVYCTGEFGRTPTVNAAAGRDHWARTMTALLAGGSFRRGHVHGATDADGSEPTTDACSPDDLSASIFAQLGFAPQQMIATRSGRPLPLFRNGTAIRAIVN
jgi:hypothetical protein